MTPSLIIANWKMHKTISEAQAFCRDFIVLSRGLKKTTVVICPPFTALAAAAASLKSSDIKLGAQDVHWEAKGAYTGEISPAQLVDAGCRYVIIGHSERRQILGETDIMIRKKVKAALGAGLIPILCVGETLQERQENKAYEIVEQQITGALKDIEFTEEDLVIAYEPVWAIGTGVNASYQDADEMAAHIRTCLQNINTRVMAAKIPLLYGGSVKADNFAEFLQGSINGALVGGASLEADSFFQIVRLCESA
ncbi:MAG TPA: triose-phosphate isomerase [Syntrophomonadaceae bacterium]|mgnify:FL=1|nr:triose-phosphate isomerase [Syntrophomonadaceae bacterium]